MDQAKLLKKIGALLNKAESLQSLGEAYWPEAEACSMRAHELLTEYQLELADVIAARPDVAPRFVHKTEVIPGPYNGVKEWRRQLIFPAGRLAYAKGYTLGTYHVMIVGREVDVTVGFQFWYSWMNQLEAMCDIQAEKAWREGVIGSPRRGQTHGRQWRQSFYLSAAKSLDRRVNEELAKRAGNVQAIVLSTEEQIRQYEAENFRTVTIHEPPEYFSDLHARLVGSLAGGAVHLGHGVASSEQAKELEASTGQARGTGS